MDNTTELSRMREQLDFNMEVIKYHLANEEVDSLTIRTEIRIYKNKSAIEENWIDVTVGISEMEQSITYGNEYYSHNEYNINEIGVMLNMSSKEVQIVH